MTISELTKAELKSISERTGAPLSQLTIHAIKSAKAFLGCSYASGTKWAKAQPRHDFAALNIKYEGEELVVSFVLDVNKRLVISHVESPLDDLEYYAPRIISDTQVDIRNGLLAV